MPCTSESTVGYRADLAPIAVYLANSSRISVGPSLHPAYSASVGMSHRTLTVVLVPLRPPVDLADRLCLAVSCLQRCVVPHPLSGRRDDNGHSLMPSRLPPRRSAPFPLRDPISCSISPIVSLDHCPTYLVSLVISLSSSRAMSTIADYGTALPWSASARPALDSTSPRRPLPPSVPLLAVNDVSHGFHAAAILQKS